MTLFQIFKVPQAKILDLMFENKDAEYSIRQLNEITKIPSRTLQRHLPLLVKEGFLVKYHPTWNGNVYLYRFNGKNLRAFALSEVSTTKESSK